ATNVSDTSNTGAPGLGQIGRNIGDDDSAIESTQYFKPLHAPLTWTTEKVDEAVSLLSPSCTGDRAIDPASEKVAVAFKGECKEVSRQSAREDLDKLGQLYATQGIDLVETLRNKATS